MIIAASKILELNEKYNFISGISEREKNPGVGFDVRVGEIFKISGEAFLGVEDRQTPKLEKVAEFGKDKFFILKPGEFVLVRTVEVVNLPKERVEINGKKYFIMQDTYPRSSLQRCGVFLKTTLTDPGYHGKLTFAMKNEGNINFKIELGARIAAVVFKAVLGDTIRGYSGRYNGGRVSSNGVVEKQV